jgi:hypothetical protein
MASNEELIALEALRHFKSGELYSWVNDENASESHFAKCLRAIQHVRRTNNRDFKKDALEELEERARTAPRKKELHQDARRLEGPVDRQRSRSPLTYSLVPIGSNHIEFRAITQLGWKELSRIAARNHEIDPRRNTISDRAWQWIEVSNEFGFTGTFVLNYADGIIFGQISSHFFNEELELEFLARRVAEAVGEKLQIRR